MADAAAAEPGQAVVPRDMWPNYPCNEQGGRGWLVDFTGRCGRYSKCEFVQREAVRFIAASQPHAGDVLNRTPSPCGPSSGCRRGRCASSCSGAFSACRSKSVSRARAPTCTARGGKVQDPMGDAASNIGRAGHNQRHAAVLTGASCSACRACGGS